MLGRQAGAKETQGEGCPVPSRRRGVCTELEVKEEGLASGARTGQ